MFVGNTSCARTRYLVGIWCSPRRDVSFLFGEGESDSVMKVSHDTNGVLSVPKPLSQSMHDSTAAVACQSQP